MVNMVLVIMVSVVAVMATWNIARCHDYKKKWKNLQGEYDKRCKELTDALVEVGRVKSLNEDLAKDKDIIAKQISDFECRVGFLENEVNNKESVINSWLGALADLQFTAFKHLCVMEERYPATVLPPSTNKRAVSVVIRHPKFPKSFIIIKDFWYDKMDEADYEFAKSEAEELLETIQKF